MEGDDRNNPGFMGNVLGRAKKVLFPDMTVVESAVFENHQLVISENHTLKTTNDEEEEEVKKKPRVRRRRGGLMTSSSSSLVSIASPRPAAGMRTMNAEADFGSVVVVGKENRKPHVTNNNNKTKRASSTTMDSLVTSLADDPKIDKLDKRSDNIASINNAVERQKKTSISSSIGRNRKSDGTSSLHFCGDASVSSRQLVKSNESKKYNHSTDEVTYSIDDIDASLVAVGSSNDDRTKFSRNRDGHGSRRNHPRRIVSSLVQEDDMTDRKKINRSTIQRGSSSSDPSSVITKRRSSSSGGLSSLMTLPSSMQKAQKSRRDKRDRWKTTMTDSRHTKAPHLSSGQVAANPLNRQSSESLRIEEHQNVETVVCSTPHTIRHRSIQPGEGGDGIMSPPAFLHRFSTALSNENGGGWSNIFDSGNPSLKKRFDSKTTPDRISDDLLIEDDVKSSLMSSPLSLVTKMSSSPYVFEKSSITLNAAASSPIVLVTSSSHVHMSSTNNQNDDTIKSDAIIERSVRGSAVLDVEVVTVPLTKKKEESNTSNVPLQNNTRTKSHVGTNVKSTRSVVNRTVGVRPSLPSKVVHDDTTMAGVRRSSRQTIPTDRLTITHKKSSKLSKNITTTSSMNQNYENADVKVLPPKKIVVITTDDIANESAPKGNIALTQASATDKQDYPERPIPHSNANQSHKSYNANDDNIKDEDGWSTKEMQILRNCQKDIDPTSTYYWQEVANQVSSKSAMECQIKWQSLIPTPKVRRAVTKKTSDKESAADNCVVAGAASTQDDNYEEDDDEDDIFNSTPYRVADAVSGRPRNANMFSSLGASTDRVTLTCLKPSKVVSKVKETPALKARRKGYNSYIENLRKDINRGEKKTKMKKTMSLIDHRHKLQQQINANMTIGENKLSGKLLSNGTVQIKVPDENDETEDDMWATNGDQDDEDEK